MRGMKQFEDDILLTFYETAMFPERFFSQSNST